MIGVTGTKQQLLQLMADKDSLESKISEFGQILKNNKDVGMKGPLVDEDEFPRNDIDVHQVRQARQQILCLQNDHKELMKQIEKLIHKLHAESPADDGNSTEASPVGDVTPTTNEPKSAEPTHLEAIAKINSVAESSPAEVAGLRINDEILQFGSINKSNFSNNLTEIATVVRHMENQRIPLKVRRNDEILDVILIPKKWTGAGLLGCNIVLAK